MLKTLVLTYLFMAISSAYSMSRKQYETSIKNIMDFTSSTFNGAFQFALVHKDYEF